MPVFETIVLLQPQDGDIRQERIIGPYAMRICADAESAERIALKEAEYSEKDADRVQVLVRPFDED